MQLFLYIVTASKMWVAELLYKYTENFYGWTAQVGLGLPIVQVARSYSDSPHSVGLLCTSDQPLAETCNLQHTTLTTHNTHNTQQSQHTTLTTHNTHNTQHSQHTTLKTHNTHNTTLTTQHSQHTTLTTFTTHNTHNTTHNTHNTTHNTHNTTLTTQNTQHSQHTTLTTHNTQHSQHSQHTTFSTLTTQNTQHSKHTTLTTHNNHNRQTCMLPARIEPVIPTDGKPQIRLRPRGHWDRLCTNASREVTTVDSLKGAGNILREGFTTRKSR